MILNILFFIGWTVAIFALANYKNKQLLDIIHKQEQRYDECCDKLKLRSKQNDVLMQTINNLNKQLNDKNEEGLTFSESFSGLLGKQYLFLQEDNITYYNRYTDEYMTEEEAVDWLYSELSEIINGGKLDESN